MRYWCYVSCVMSRTNCVYCGKEITTRSSEHVIQNALGGRFESTDICCPECNNHISQHIDNPFTKTFNPIIGQIGDLTKSHNKNSTPPYTGTVQYQGNQYKATIKAGKVVGCPDLNKLLRCDATKLPLEIVSFDFVLNNENFRNGMGKIAFNYALAQNIDFDLIKDGLTVTKSGDNITDISFKYPLVPFYPLNPLDDYLELCTETELYHNMILFSQQNQLWCYIDLFNTFQYYVKLSDTLPQGTNIYHNYMQLVRKIDRTEPELHIHRQKDILLYTQQYGIEPTTDIQELKKRISKAISEKTQQQPMTDIITDKINSIPITYYMMMGATPNLPLLTQTMQLYLEEEVDDDGFPIYGSDKLNEKNFRTVTINPHNGDVVSYPDALVYSMMFKQDALRKYTTQKFNKLTQHLLEKSK